MKEKDEVETVYYKFYDLMLDLCETHDPILVSSTMLAVSQKLCRTVHEDDNEYLRIMNYITRNALQIEPIEFEDKTYH